MKRTLAMRVMAVTGLVVGASCSSGSDSSSPNEPAPAATVVSVASTAAPAPSATAAAAVADRHDIEFEFLSSLDNNVPEPICTKDGKGCVQRPDSPVSRTDLTGDWTGELVDATGFTGNNVTDPAGYYQYQSAGIRPFVGTVEPCGTGGLTFVGEDENLVALDGSTGKPTREGRWWIVPDSGWGDLEGISGGGTIELEITAGVNGATVRFFGFVDCSGATASPVPTVDPASLDELFSFTVPTDATLESKKCLTDSTRCARVATMNIDEISGSWSGQLVTAAGRFKILGDPERELQEGVTVFSGTAGDCGGGTLAMRHYTDFATTSASLTNGEDIVADGYWEIVPGYGTGSLAGTAGEGRWTASVDNGTLVVGVLGSIDCGVVPLKSTVAQDACPEGAPATFECWTVTAPVDYDDPTGPTFALGVTVDRMTPGVWTNPVLRQSGAWSAVDWTLALPVGLDGHDSVYVDTRGFGRSAPLPECPGIAERFGNWNANHNDPELDRLMSECVTEATTAPVPLDAIADLDNVAHDFATVRRALKIDRWGLAATRAGLDPLLRLIELEPEAVTGLLATSPQVAGIGRSIDTENDAFDRFAADCAALPSCAAKGDLHDLLERVLTRLADEVTSNVFDGNGQPIVLDASAILSGISVGLADASIAPVIPDLLAGLAAGSGTDAVAGYYARTMAITAMAQVWNCQQLSFVRSDPSTIGDPASENPFARSNRAARCRDVVSVPQVTAAPSVSTPIPVLVILQSYDTNSSEENAAKILAGFAATTTVFAPGVSDSAAQLPACYAGVRSAFFDDPSKAVDASCLANPASPILQ